MASDPPVPPRGERTVDSTAEAVNTFGVDLLRQVLEGGNAVISPPSVAIALSMLANGADGQALAELNAALYSDGDEARRNAELAALLSEIVKGEEVDIRVAQSLWAQQGFPFRLEYMERVQQTFDATLDEVDFADAATGGLLDHWVSEHTNGLIKTIAADLGLPDPLMVLVLLNATYFHGKWMTPFHTQATRERTFHTDEATVRVPFLTDPLGGHFAYAETAVWQLLRLPYGDDGRFAMDLYLPRTGHTTAEVLGDLADDRRPRGQQLEEVAIPKLKLEWKGDLKQALQALGVQKVWGRGNLERMSPSKTVYLSTAVHKTYIEVDEKGTKAAAVTGMAMRAVSAPVTRPQSFVADRPFAFAIRDTRTGVVIFAGVVNNPLA